MVDNWNLLWYNDQQSCEVLGVQNEVLLLYKISKISGEQTSSVTKGPMQKSFN